MKKSIKTLTGIAAIAGAAYSACLISNKKEENKQLDADNPYLTALPEQKSSEEKESFYLHFGKKAIDTTLAFCGLTLLSPVFAAISAAIVIDDPGPVFFKQKRVGKNCHFFELHKFRSMKMSTPHDVPTHELSNPEQYITRVGKFLRKTSLDELPQVWDILRGKMSIIGPRPALWNQDDLVAERAKYGANDLMPGLTGWAQINGRDELEIPEKARLDGEYKENLSLLFDAKCFFGTISSVLNSEGVVEGGTGEMHKRLRAGVPEEDPSVVFGCDKEFNIQKDTEKKVLITGAGSYIGESFRAYAAEHYPNLHIDAVDTIGDDWKKVDFSEYDCVYHVAGIAHADVGNVDDETKEKYYAINTDLAIEAARMAKEAGVSQFILMSSMIVYGESAPFGKKRVITRNTAPAPANFYGDSKWQADKGVRALEDESFKVAVLRPPMIYGKGSKGNYPVLAKMAKKLPVFPYADNERSMLYIGNLCEFLCNLIMSGEGGVYFPQNKEYTNTSEMVREIGRVTGNKTILTHVLTPAVKAGSFIPGKISKLVNKAFGNNCYDKELSSYTFDYCLYDLKESIEKTEGAGAKKALVLASVASMIDQFNLSNIRIMQEEGFCVDVCADFTDPGTITKERADALAEELRSKGSQVIDVHIPRSLNIKEIISAYRQVSKLLKKEDYQLIHCHSPIGGAIARAAASGYRKKGTKVIYTAHGFHFYDGAPLKNWAVFYPVEKFLSRYTDLLITINKEDYNRAKENFHAEQTAYIPGVGVDTKKFADGRKNKMVREEFGIPEDKTLLLSVGELNENKNHETVIRAIAEMDEDLAYIIVGKGPKEDELKQLISQKGLQDKVFLAGFRSNVADYYKSADVYVFPSFREGLSVALMEAMASGMPVVCSKIRGNTDLIEEGKGGYFFDPGSPESVIDALKRMLGSDMKAMGVYNKKTVENFDIRVIDAKMTELYGEQTGK